MESQLQSRFAKADARSYFKQTGYYVIKTTHPKIFFNNIPASKVDYRIHLGLILYSRLSFDMHVKMVIDYK